MLFPLLSPSPLLPEASCPGKQYRGPGVIISRNIHCQATYYECLVCGTISPLTVLIPTPSPGQIKGGYLETPKRLNVYLAASAQTQSPACLALSGWFWEVVVAMLRWEVLDYLHLHSPFVLVLPVPIQSRLTHIASIRFTADSFI